MASASKLGKDMPAAFGRLLTPEDVSAIVGISVETLAQWRSQRRGLPYLKIARNCVRYTQAALDEFLAARTVAVAPLNAGRER
jgi:hypothetical protein